MPYLSMIRAAEQQGTPPQALIDAIDQTIVSKNSAGRRSAERCPRTGSRIEGNRCAVIAGRGRIRIRNRGSVFVAH